MFLDSYPTYYCGIDRNKVRPSLIETHLFRFKDHNRHRYIVRAEKYPLKVFAIKFFLKAHRFSENKYNLTTNFGTPTRILGTCIQVMVELHQKYPDASFVIFGANSINEKPDNTKRFRIYKAILGRFFSPLKFRHIVNPKKSVYLLINADELLYNPLLAAKITNMIS